MGDGSPSGTMEGKVNGVRPVKARLMVVTEHIDESQASGI